jgi:hypothetical protein
LWRVTAGCRSIGVDDVVPLEHRAGLVECGSDESQPFQWIRMASSW